MRIKLWAIATLLLSLLLAEATGGFAFVDRWVQAKRYLLSRSPVESNIVVVAVDAKSIAAIGQWPWSRAIHARILDKLVAGQAGQVAFDIDFSSASPVSGDEDFVKALKAAGGSTILAGFKQIDSGEFVDTVPLGTFSENAWVATVSVRADRDGVVRRVPHSEMLAGQQTPSLAAYLAQANGNDQSDINIDFAISSSSFPLISAIDVLEGRVPASIFQGKDVIIGATAVELRDFYVTPIGEIVPGSILQALASETARLDRSIATPGSAARWAGIGVILLLGLAVRRRSMTGQLALFAVSAAALEPAALFLQQANHISLPTTGWLAALGGLAIITTASELGLRKLWIGSIQSHLGATKALLQEVIADSPAGVIVVDEGNRIRVANLAARRILDQVNAGWVGKTVEEALPTGLAKLFAAPSPALDGDASLQQQGELSLMVSQSQKMFEYSLTTSRVAKDDSGASSAYARCLTFQDVTERHEHMQRLSYLALHDAVTGARNRNSLVEDLEQFAAKGETATVVHIGIDRFRYINEDFGHEIGDLLLKDLAARSSILLGDECRLYRVAGDEFASIIGQGPQAAEAARLAQGFLSLSGPIQLGPYEVPLSLSVGVASASGTSWNADEIIRRSGLALNFAKADGGNSLCFFDAQLDAAATRRKALESALIGAVDRQEFHLLYQPQFDLPSGRCIGVEALLRWTNPALGAVPPGEFIPVAEQIGIIDEIGDWVLRHACNEMSRICSEIVVAVNVSTRQFLRGNLTELVSEALASSGLPQKRLEIEITESVLAENTSKTVETLQQLRASGVTVALDDFGTGYSSLSYLLNLPLDKIKIDKSFVTPLSHDPKAVAVLNSIIGVAKALGLKAIAEGIETAEQANALKDAGCQQGQGYLFAKPMGPEALAIYLRILGFNVRDPGSIALPGQSDQEAGLETPLRKASA